MFSTAIHDNRPKLIRLKYIHDFVETCEPYVQATLLTLNSLGTRDGYATSVNAQLATPLN
ncbi:hypothetical protein MB901379_02614 [Mycobacterium basiliense]|uniref:Uncharacterized protein n=1 Tax=Mycobacterium basiliense TaxID=2094119 RepID=A0A3S4DTS8_9MYCO|nr:hypothetical protein MB901379_02614 [Mycobacterium basiliense]